MIGPRVKLPGVPKAKGRVQRHQPGVMTEAAFQKSVIDFAHLNGWRVAHFRKVRVQRKNGSTYWQTPATADGVGWLDLFLAHEARGIAVAAELKVGGNKPTKEQRDWLRWLARAGIPTRLWYPEDWPEIQVFLGNES